MKALLLDRQVLYRQSLAALIRDAGFYMDVLEAASAADFVRLATENDDIGLVVAYPQSVELGLATCVCMVERLTTDAHVAIFRDKPEQAEKDYPHVGFLDRAAGAEEIAATLRLVEQDRGDTDGAIAVSSVSVEPADTHAQSGKAALQPMSVPGVRGNATAGSEALLRRRCADLSQRQRQIMAMVAEGLANKEIAARLGIAEGTVKAHIHAVFKALGVTNRTQAVVRYGGVLPRVG